MPTILLILLALIALVLLRFRHIKPVVLNPLLALVLLAAIWGAVARISNSDVRTESVARHVFHEAQGEMLGRELVGVVPDGGAVAVVRLSPARWIGAESLLEAELKGLRAALDSGNYPITVVHLPDPPGEDAMPVETLSEADYRGLLAQVPGVKAVVLQHALFEPAPGSRAEQFPPAFVILGGDGPMDRLLRGGFVRAATSYKPDADWETVPNRKMSPDEVFGLRYQIVRP